MKVHVNHERCAGHARCAARAPHVYVLDEEGYNRMSDFTVSASDEREASLGARACPERAITIAAETATAVSTGVATA